MTDVKRIPLNDHFGLEDRGWALNLLEAVSVPGDRLGNLHVVSMKPGAGRGNHYHPNATEWLLICGGPSKLAVCAGDNNTIQEILVEGTKPELFQIPPGRRHAVQNLSDVEIYLVVFADVREPTTVQCPSLISSHGGEDPR